MDFAQYKCPCCGSALKFSPKTQKLTCESCDNEYDIATLKEVTTDEQAPENEDILWNRQTGVTLAKKTSDGLYICPSCGASIEADETKVSTICPYCDNVVVIKETVADENEPDLIIPFQVNADDARQKLEHFCKGKHLLPKNFKDRSYLKNIKGYYVPYWLFNCSVDADMSFNATKTRAWSDSHYDYVETSFYLVTREGNMSFSHVPVDGSIKMEDETTESIEPFDYSQVTKFNPAYLAGYETDKYDVTSETASKRVKERLYNSAEDMLRDTVRGYDTVNAKRRQLTSSDAKVEYALLPVWLFETVYNDKNYQFAINGQTGKMVGELPVDDSLFWKYLIGFTGIGTIVLSILGILILGGGF